MAEFYRKKKKVCQMCAGKSVDYKDPEILRKYIKSPRVVNVAKKYFNCSDIKGVELEDQNNELHWESRILLGEIMTIEGYEPEQVLSEFTLAFLEDLGYYKANYYTGGLMQ